MCDKDGKTVIATIAQGHDITERKQAVEEIRCQKNELVELNKSLESANDRLKDLDQIKSDFLSTVSHEIRTPIAIIHEAVSLCLDGDGGKLQEKHSRYLNMAQNNIDRLTRLVTDLLDISKIEQNKLKLRKSSMDLWNTAQKIHNEYRPRAESKGIRLELDRQFSGDTLRFYGDEDKIIQILNNLLGNAIRCSALGGQITIRLIDEKDFVRFAISDTGIGISKENASKLFDKFQQIGRVDGPGYKGTGLGLAISKGLVEKHGGKIWIESELGQGSTFYFTLKKELFPKILIVDDSKELIELVQQMLAETEYRYTEAYDGEQAVQIAQNDRFDLILLDMQLPKMSGYEVIGRLKQDKRTHDIPILIMSAFSVDRDHVNQISDETAIPVIKKPFVIDEIKETVEELLIN
jgi:signal transduction histidine kinase